MTKKKEDRLRKEFYSFQKKVNRLGEFKKEISSLESKGLTKGLEKEVSIIKSRLKDTSALPELEKNIKDLRKKILKKRDVKKKSPIKRLSKKIENIEESVEKLQRSSHAKPPIGKLQEHIEEIGDSNKDLKKAIKDLQNKIIENDKKRNKQGKINGEVDLMVDEEFSVFVNDLKLNLSKKVKRDEEDLNRQLKNDVELRKKNLELKYKELDRKLKEEYSDRVKTGLHEEIERKFSSELRKKFDEEKAKLDLTYVNEMKKKYHDAFEKQKKLLEKRYENKIKGYDKSLESNKKKIVNEAHQEMIKELYSFKRKLHSQMHKEFIDKMDSFLEEQKKKQQREVEEKTKQLHEAFSSEKKAKELLKKNIAQRKYEIEELKEKNRQLLLQQARLRNEEAMKREEEHKLLVEKHKRETQEVTNKIRKDTHNKFEAELKKTVFREQKKFTDDFNKKLLEEKHKLENLSFKERRAYKEKLKQEFNKNLRKSIDQKVLSLREQLRKQFVAETHIKTIEEHRKLDEKLAEFERKFREREMAIKTKEKELIAKNKQESMELASEKKRLFDKFTLIKKNDEDKLEQERVRLKRRFASESHAQMVKELARKEAILKANLERQFNERMKNYKKDQEAALEKKKAELSRELQSKAKALLG